jgi:hypothetical protein
MGAVQTPAPVQATVHGEPLSCHAPLGPQDWGCKGPSHCISPGAHSPAHSPDTHVCSPQSIAAPHRPEGAHVSTLLPTHRVAGAAQTAPLSTTPSPAASPAASGVTATPLSSGIPSTPTSEVASSPASAVAPTAEASLPSSSVAAESAAPVAPPSPLEPVVESTAPAPPSADGLIEESRPSVDESGLEGIGAVPLALMPQPAASMPARRAGPNHRMANCALVVACTDVCTDPDSILHPAGPRAGLGRHW